MTNSQSDRWLPGWVLEEEWSIFSITPLCTWQILNTKSIRRQCFQRTCVSPPRFVFDNMQVTHPSPPPSHHSLMCYSETNSSCSLSDSWCAACNLPRTSHSGRDFYACLFCTSLQCMTTEDDSSHLLMSRCKESTEHNGRGIQRISLWISDLFFTTFSTCSDLLCDWLNDWMNEQESDVFW